MVCLLCYDCSGDYISLTSHESQQNDIAPILFKYFRFMFESEPGSGEICRKCWIKVEMFHVFYQRIEEIQLAVINVQPIVVENIDLVDKTEENTVDCSRNSPNDVSCESGGPFTALHVKFDQSPDDNIWTDESDVHLSDDAQDEYPSMISTRQSSNRTVRSAETEKEIIENETRSDPVEQKPNKVPLAKIKKESAVKNSKVKSRISDKVYRDCPVSRKCTRKFVTEDELTAHCAVDHKRYHCTHCPNVRLFADLYKHLREVHGIIENAICEHCGQIFSCNRTLQEHIKRKHTTCDPVQCDICKEWFKSRETIRSHMNYVHIQGTQTCGICGKVSANRKALRAHLNIHSEAWRDKFKCVICGKGFRSSTKLREHSYIHSGKTDAYICQFCGKSFRFNSSISAHRMKYHPVEMAHVKERLQKKRNMEFKV